MIFNIKTIKIKGLRIGFQVLVYLLLFATPIAVHSSGDKKVQFKRGVYSTLSDSSVAIEAVKPNMKESLKKTPRYHTILQFDELPTELEKAELVKQGIILLEYISDNAYWAKFINQSDAVNKSSALKRVNKVPAVHMWMPPNEVKVSVEMENVMKTADNELVNVIAIFHKGVSKSTIKQKLNETGAITKISWLGSETARITAPITTIELLIDFDELKWVEQQAAESEDDDLEATRRTGVDRITRAPLSLTGQGITLGIWDGGRPGSHNDVNDRVTILTNDVESSHATRVTGVAIGNGAGNPTAIGMAPQARARNRSRRDFNFENDVANEARDNLIQISNFSFSTTVGWSGDNDRDNDFLFGLYSAEASVFDGIAYNHGLLMFKSASNNRDDCNPNDSSDCDGDDEGYDSIPHRGAAKNMITVGNTDANNNVSISSGWGPTDDGRIKPDLCAYGSSLLSTEPNNEYRTIGGTSAASPAAAGVAALLYEHYDNVYGELPSDSALIKGAMLHSATEFGVASGPDPICGWGIVNAESAAKLISQEAFLTGTASQGSQIDIGTISVQKNQAQVKVTLIWTDPPGNPATSKALVNNLDLRLIDSNNNEYLPWSLDSSNNFRTAVRSDNSRDNVEQITIDSPPAGDYTIRILTGDIPSGPQDYVLFREVVESVLSDELCFPIKTALGEVTIVCL